MFQKLLRAEITACCKNSMSINKGKFNYNLIWFPCLTFLLCPDGTSLLSSYLQCLLLLFLSSMYGKNLISYSKKTFQKKASVIPRQL